MSDARNMEDFTKSLRSSATLLLRTLDRLQFEYSETSAREVSERVSYWPNLIGWKIARRQFQWHICATGTALAYEKFSGDWSVRDLKNRALSERIALLKELQSGGRRES